MSFCEFYIPFFEIFNKMSFFKYDQNFNNDIR